MNKKLLFVLWKRKINNFLRYNVEKGRVKKRQSLMSLKLSTSYLDFLDNAMLYQIFMFYFPSFFGSDVRIRFQ